MIYASTASFPKEEMYGLTSQIRRAAVSIPANIAEGQARTGTRDLIRFLIMARSSSAELETLMIISKELSFLTVESCEVILNECESISNISTP
ncbi:MAG: four helix bundle protein [Bacteroidota bacterium]|nr:four helix bundle protein [Bacteroidota bacterium]